MADLRASGLGGVPKGATADRPSSPSIGDVFYNGTLGYQEVYSQFGWFPLNPIVSAAPTSVVGTNVGTSRAYNNGAVSVAFNANTAGGVPASFNVTASTGQTGSGTTSPIVLTGIASAATPTFTVTATNNYGTSSASSASSAVTVTTVPQAPSISAAAGNTLATITITPGANGGSSVTQYSITSNPATTTQTTSNTTYTFTGLTNGTSYTFTATATNANGTSVASSASNSISPSSWNGSVEVLLIAGGGGSSRGSGASGGSGAGGYLEGTMNLTAGTTYNISIGSGGPAATVSNTINSSLKGTDSTFNGATAKGGGVGPTNGAAGLSGGSGAGACGYVGNGSQQPETSATQGNSGGLTGYGNPGGSGQTISNGTYGGSGGGGAGGVGGNCDNAAYPNGNGGPGGIGKASSITGTSVYYAGGGGGGYDTNNLGAAGGLGGGGTGSKGNNASGSGQINTGGGAGGTANAITGGSGGSGICIIKTTINAASTTGSPLNPSTGLYIFNNSGSITF